jgi:hypothetical protein
LTVSVSTSKYKTFFIVLEKPRKIPTRASERAAWPVRAFGTRGKSINTAAKNAKVSEIRFLTSLDLKG